MVTSRAHILTLVGPEGPRRAIGVEKASGPGWNRGNLKAVNSQTDLGEKHDQIGHKTCCL